MNTKHALISVLIILCIWITGYSQTQISGSVTGFWKKTNSPYIVIGDVKVEEGDTLVIEPGVQVLFDGHFKLYSRGHLQASGTETDSIIFTHNHPDSIWAGILLYGGSDQSILEYCRIEYSNQSGIDIAQSYPIIKHCHILHNTDVGSQYQVGMGGGINVNGANPIIQYNVIEFNSANRGGGIHIDGYFSELRTECQILNNIVRYNTATWGGGIRVFSSSPIIKNNIFDGNSVADSLYGGNLYVFPGSQPTIVQNIIINSPSGSGLLDLSNSTIRYNNVWNNISYDYVDTPPGVGDISIDPLFLSGIPSDYHLQPNSPCVDAGDPNEPMDPDNSRADIGVFYVGTNMPPLTVTNLSATAGDSRITFEWQNPNLIDYDKTIIVRNDNTYPQSPDDGITIFEGTQTLWQDIGLTNEQTYYYSVLVFDEAGMVSQAAQISATPVHQTSSVIRVPWDFLKIQNALNAADAGDTVFVFPGRYSPSTNGEEFPIMMTDGVVLKSSNGKDETIIDAEQMNLVIRGANGATIQGFTITGGWNSTFVADSVGIYSKAFGGGILCKNILFMKIIDNNITRNRVDGPLLPDGRGGGIGCYNSGILISHNIISDNYAQREYGGIACIASGKIGNWPDEHYPECTIQYNSIISNHGCGIGIGGIEAIVKYNIIADNRVNGGGIPIPGGIDLAGFYWGSAHITNNTVAYNYNVNQPGNISGIYYTSGTNEIILKNNIVWGHRKEEVVIGHTVLGGADNFKVSYCCVEDGYPGEGNISDSPEFVGGEAFDYHLAANSPCIDAGDPSFTLDPDSSRADIGAFNFYHQERAKLIFYPAQLTYNCDQGQDSTFILQVENSGTMALNFSIVDKLGSNKENANQPDEYGYSWINSDENTELKYDWIEISDIGIELDYTGWGKNFGPIDMNFETIFYDETFSSIRICSNGFLSFSDGDHGGWNHNIPFSLGPNNLVSVFWDDFSFTENDFAGRIFYYIDEINNRFIVQYDSLRHDDPNWGHETFQSIINNDGSIIFQYKEVTTGNSCTIGVQNHSGYFGLQIAYDEELIHNNYAIKIFQGAEWITLKPLHHRLMPGETTDIPIQLSSKLLNCDSYDAKIVIESNDNDRAKVEIPVYLNVNPTNVDHVHNIPKKFELFQNYPNPFNPVTTINYQLPKTTNVELTIYNSIGQKVVKLVDEHKQAGYHFVNWDAKEMASGLYFYRIKAGEFEQVRKMLLLH
jgi:hypothetical protein